MRRTVEHIKILNYLFYFQEYYDAGGLKGFAEAKKNVKGEVKKIREATKVVEKYTAK